MGGYNYNFSSYGSMYGDETPRQTNYVQLSPLLCYGPHALLFFGLAIRSIPRLHRKVGISLKFLFLLGVTGIKKVIAYFKKSI